MEDEKKHGLFGNDDLDKAIPVADDTGMVAQQQFIAEEEILEGEGELDKDQGEDEERGS